MLFASSSVVLPIRAVTLTLTRSSSACCFVSRQWFLGNEHARGLAPPDWYDRLCVRLLQGERRVQALVRVPEQFSGVGRQPRYMRTMVYDYRFVHGHEADSAEKAEENKRRRTTARSIEWEMKRLIEDEDEVGDSDGREERLARRREQLSRGAGGVEGGEVTVNESDFWYRLRFVGQYGPTYSLDSVERRLL